MAVRAAYKAPIEPQLVSSLGGSCAAGAAALFASSARPNRALSAFRFCRLPEPHRRAAPGFPGSGCPGDTLMHSGAASLKSEALVVSSRGSLQAKNPAAGGRASEKGADCRVGPAGPSRNDAVRLFRLRCIPYTSVLFRACTQNPNGIVFRQAETGPGFLISPARFFR